MNQRIKLSNPHKKQEGIFDSRFLVVLGGVIFLIVLLGYFFYGLQPMTESSDVVEFKVSEGESFRNIAAKLSQEDLIKSISVFKGYALLSGQARSFKPGIYELSSTMSIPEIITKLVIGGKTDVSMTIPEGLTIKDIDYLLSNAEIIEQDSLTNYKISDELTEEYPFLEANNSLEGFLFPDTYHFSLNSSPDRVVRKFLNNFNNKAWSEINDNNNWYDLLILASFLEREVKTSYDRKVVAGILLKRLQNGMRLQVDATVSYAKCDEQFLQCSNLQINRSDIETSSPYNTYESFGWTPTPISNPGLDTIQAAENPIPSQYWYYLSAEETGETIFSRTLDEHNTNVVKYL